MTSTTTCPTGYATGTPCIPDTTTSTTVTTTTQSPRHPDTGVSTDVVAPVGLLAVMLGAALLVLARRR